MFRSPEDDLSDVRGSLLSHTRERTVQHHGKGCRWMCGAKLDTEFGAIGISGATAGISAANCTALLKDIVSQNPQRILGKFCGPAQM